MTCFVKDCKNVRRLCGVTENISFHLFPSNFERREQWLKAIDRTFEELCLAKRRYVCSRHFEENDFTDFGNNYRTLKYEAIPHIRKTPIDGSPIKEKSQELLNESLLATCGPSIPESLICNDQLLNTDFEDMELHFDEPCPNPQKRAIKFSSDSSCSSGARKRRRIRIEHSYMLSPSKLRAQLSKTRYKYHVQAKKAQEANKKIIRLKKQVRSLKNVITSLKSKDVLSNTATNHLDQIIGAIPNTILNRMLKYGKGSTSQYPEDLRHFAITLQFYSNKAYEYVRKTFNYCLPHPSTIRKWSSNVDCGPGFSQICFDTLAQKVADAKQEGRELICNLVLDEMSIKKHLDFDGQRNWGFIDIGIDIQDDGVDLATEALVLMVVCLNSSWKLPIAYFFIKSLSGAEKANIIQEALKRCSEISLTIAAVICDGPPEHFTMFKKLGCNFNDICNLSTSFKHPGNPSGKQKIFAMFDICHMLKLLRNAFAVKQVLIDVEGNFIKWEFIEKLNSIQNEECLHLANKLGRKHIEWKKYVMKVNVAAQTLSNSVAEAISFLANDLQHPDFQGSEATIKFIKIIDKLFDILNSRLPWAKGFKGPLKTSNELEWRTFLEDTTDYLINLKDIDDQYLWKTRRKTSIYGFAISIASVIQIFDEYVFTKKMNYLLTYKLSQDHLELFFCAIRARNGWNNNPSCLQFMRSFKKLLLHADISDSSGNCKVLDATSVLYISSKSASKKQSQLDQISLLDIKKNQQETVSYVAALNEHDYDILPHIIELNDYQFNVVTYIAGYVLKMLTKFTHCPQCLNILMENEEHVSGKNYSFMKKRNLGSYSFPSQHLTKICRLTEMFIRKLMHLTNNKLPSNKILPFVITNVAAQVTPQMGRIIFTQPQHEDHDFILLKSIINAYCKIRFHNLAKKYSLSTHDDLIRKQFSKLIIFHHQ